MLCICVDSVVSLLAENPLAGRTPARGIVLVAIIMLVVIRIYVVIHISKEDNAIIRLGH